MGYKLLFIVSFHGTESRKGDGDIITIFFRKVN